MYCSNCGGLVPDGQYTCPNCGAYVGSTGQTYNDPNQNMQQGYYQNNMQNNMQNNSFNNAGQMYQNNIPYAQQSVQPELGMKWFKFVIYFQLFFSALVNIINGFRISTGLHYGVTSRQLDYIYNHFDGLKMLDVCIGICIVVLGVLALITRFMLSGYKKCGPSMYIGLLIANIVIGFIYIAAFYFIVSSVSPDVSISGDTFITLVTNLTLLVLNIIYFKKRKHLFVN